MPPVLLYRQINCVNSSVLSNKWYSLTLWCGRFKVGVYSVDWLTPFF